MQIESSLILNDNKTTSCSKLNFDSRNLVIAHWCLVASKHCCLGTYVASNSTSIKLKGH